MRENKTEEQFREKAQAYPNLASFIKDKMLKTQELYEKKYSLQYPCIYDIADVTNDKLGTFELATHNEQHKKEPEERCQYCQIQDI